VVCALLTAGHVPPLLVRGRDTQPLQLPGNFPLGMFAEADDYRNGAITLQPGDRLVVVTDGMRERNAAGLDLPAMLRSIGGLHPREAVRRPGRPLIHCSAGTMHMDENPIADPDFRGVFGGRLEIP
jgi:serine phosphatase RsbU (regulator of sigma subunit)